MLTNIYGVIDLIVRTFYASCRKSKNSGYLVQVFKMGCESTLVVVITSIFIGMGLCLQIGTMFLEVFNMQIWLGRLIGLSMIREFCPVLVSIIFAGKSGSSIAAEIGHMKVSDQIDALYTLGTDPISYLLVPRFLSAMLVLPLLNIICIAAGGIGGAITAFFLKTNLFTYWQDFFSLDLTTLLHSGIKAFVFAIITVAIPCYCGLNAQPGSVGVGRATTHSVIFSIISILVSNYFLSLILLIIKIE